MARLDEAFKNNKVKSTERHPRQETVYLHYTKMVDNKAQYCNEKSKDEIEALADLIEADGKILQNILVRKIDTDEYELIAGHKRRRAAKLLVEERGKEQFAFLPCTVENISDVRAEFQVYSSNSHHPKDDYERMHELERMKYLLETYPEEFPNLQRGRMVERLAKQMGMKRSTVGEYLTIACNLGKKGMEEFKNGTIKKSAAVEMSSLPEQEQEKLIDRGVISHREIKAYKEQKKAAANTEFKQLPEPEQSLEHLEPEQPMESPEQFPEHSEPVQRLEMPENLEPEPPENPEPELPLEPEGQLIGQYQIINTDMDVEEETEHVPDSGTQKEEPVPVEHWKLKNDEQRREWLHNYKAWGVWYTDDNIGVVYYKYDFPDGTRLIAETYPNEKSLAYDYVPCYLHLVGGPRKWTSGDYKDMARVPYHEYYCKEADCETNLVCFLKDLKRYGK